MSEHILSPDLAKQDRASPAFRMFRGALERASKDWRGPGLAIQLPGGEILNFGRAVGAEAILRIRSYGTIRRLLTAGDIGFAEGYIAGEWDTPDLSHLLTVLAGNFDGLAQLGVGGRLAQALNLLRHLARGNSVKGARKNIYAHYDLGNAFYAAWLDPGMTYSSALYDAPSQTLETAQREKYAALAKAIDLQPGHDVLEIGCGWGGFAEYAAREMGARVVGLTISEAQHAYAVERIRRAGLSDKVDIRLTDYRQMTGQFDRIVSIEMFEAVGERYWPTFFDTVRERLKPGGQAGLQVITIHDSMFDDYRRRVDFIKKHIFPGGMLPSESRLRAEVERAGLTWRAPRRFAHDYARTLHSWYDRFQEAWPQLKLQGFDDGFRRLWSFYLAYCEAGFATGRTDVIQIALHRP